MTQSKTRENETSSAHTEIALMLVSLLLAGFSIWLSTWDPIWDRIGVRSAELRASLSVALSVVLLLAGFLSALYLQTNRLNDRMTTEATRVVEGLNDRMTTEGTRVVEAIVARVPQMPALDIVTNQEAYDYLVKNLPNAESVRNTRIAGYGISPTYDSQNGQRYRNYLEKALVSGLQFSEVISTAWVKDAESLQDAVKKKNPRNFYNYTVLSSEGPPILNFSIIRYQNRQEEVVTGWINSRNRNWEQPCLIFRDPRIVVFFRKWYDELEREAERTSSQSRGVPA
jgi:hypothetical protein